MDVRLEFSDLLLKWSEKDGFRTKSDTYQTSLWDHSFNRLADRIADHQEQSAHNETFVIIPDKVILFFRVPPE